MNPITWIAIFNIAVFLIFGIDKLLAIKKLRRIPEAVLLSLTFVFGASGAICGMIVFRHKTAKPTFRYLIPLMFIVQAVLYFRLSNFGITL